jgi:predicted 3-demethylubiquinone-9 3-methyltransferase (glyoxalase superfamily)
VDYSKQKITTFLMFDGKAEEAMNYYVSVFDQAEIVSIHRYRATEAGTEGTVVHATFSLDGQVFMCMDRNVKHDFTLLRPSRCMSPVRLKRRSIGSLSSYLKVAQWLCR